jgi:hypothetical protein
MGRLIGEACDIVAFFTNHRTWKLGRRIQPWALNSNPHSYVNNICKICGMSKGFVTHTKIGCKKQRVLVAQLDRASVS